MFKKLKIKFSVFVSLTTFAILFLVWIILNGVMRQSVYSSMRNTLSQIQEHLKQDNPPQLPNDRISPRYILVSIDENNNFTIQSQENLYIDKKRIMDCSYQIVSKKKDFGSIDNFFYSFNADQIILVDGFADIQSLKKTFLISTIICSISFVSIAFFAILLSSLIVKPYEKLYQKERMFITNASHELKTPLAIIQTNNEILKDTYPDNKWIDSSLVQTKRMNKLILELITLSKLEELQGKIAMEDFSLSDLAYDAIVPYESIFLKKNIRIEKDIQDNIQMHGNEEYIMKVFQIFIDNALKYTKQNGIVKLQVKEDKKNIAIIFSNSTNLDSNTNLEYIFDRFYSLDSSKNKKNSGFGIGLSIAKTIIEMHKGTVAASMDGNNIVFNIRF